MRMRVPPSPIGTLMRELVRLGLDPMHAIRAEVMILDLVAEHLRIMERAARVPVAEGIAAPKKVVERVGPTRPRYECA